MKVWLPRLLWVLIPLGLVALTDALVRATVDPVPLWYAAAEEIAARERIDVLLVGDSRVAAAVYMPAFEEAASAFAGRPIRALNLGHGSSSRQQVYLGLRNLLERHPDSFKGVHVLTDAGDGWRWATPWRSQWWQEQPWMLNEVLRIRDLPRFWRLSGGALEDKIGITVRQLGRPWAVIRRRERFRSFLLKDCTRFLVARLAGDRRPFHNRYAGRPLGDDLRGWGDRSDEELNVALNQQWVIERERTLQARTRFPRIEGSLEDAIERLVTSHGGRLLFYNAPLSPIQRPAYERPGNPDGRARFEAWAAARRVSVLTPAFQADAEDFPDHSHLDFSRAPEFARSLAAAWWAANDR